VFLDPSSEFWLYTVRAGTHDRRQRRHFQAPVRVISASINAGRPDRVPNTGNENQEDGGCGSEDPTGQKGIFGGPFSAGAGRLLADTAAEGCGQSRYVPERHWPMLRARPVDCDDTSEAASGL
jgi:hypothetical protein